MRLHSVYGYSAVSTFEQCPYKYKLQYVDGIKTIPSADPANPLIVGTALHEGIEKDVKTALKHYFESYPIITDNHVNESLKLEIMIPKVAKMCESRHKVYHEFMVRNGEFIGTIDFLEHIKTDSDGTKHFTLADFKYSNNVDRYLESRQLHIYKYQFEQATGHKIDNLGYVFVPKTAIRQKKTEDLFQFRKRLITTVNKLEPICEIVQYNEEKVEEHFALVSEIKKSKEFPKNTTKLCDWCEYKEYCQKGETFMLLPKNERKEKKIDTTPDFWIYAQSYVGKTTLVDTLDDVLFLNTDGNTDQVTSPIIEIKKVQEGRTWKSAWEVFLDVLDELEKKENTFKTVAIDLIEDLYEQCRLFIYDREGWQHESDGGYGKGYDLVRTEFLSNIKRLKSMGYQLVLISKELQGAVTLRGNAQISTFRPNIPDKIANVLAGTVDLTVRAFADEKGRWINLDVDEYTFGGGRFDFKQKQIPLSKDALIKAVIDAQKTDKPKKTEEVREHEIETEPIPEEIVEEQPKTRTRRTRKERE